MKPRGKKHRGGDAEGATADAVPGAQQAAEGAEPGASDAPLAPSATGERPRKRRRREEEADCEVAEAPVAATPGAGGTAPEREAAGGGERSSSKARKAARRRGAAAANTEEEKSQAPRQKEAQEVEISEHEQKRREAQRAIQQLVVRLRAEGKSDREIKIAKRELKSQTGPLYQPTSKQAEKVKAWREWVKSEKGQQKRQDKSQREHELVVIPVVWRGRHDKDGVVQAAEDIKACVAQQGVDVWIDSRRHYTPGQKFAYWEYRGVMLRVEVGPDDMKEGVCRVCRAKTPGDYKTVEKKRVRLPPAGARALLLTLKDWGLSQIPIERRKGDSDEEECVIPVSQAAIATGARGNSKSGQGVAAAVSADDPEGNWMPRESADKAAANKRKRRREH